MARPISVDIQVNDKGQVVVKGWKESVQKALGEVEKSSKKTAESVDSISSSFDRMIKLTAGYFSTKAIVGFFEDSYQKSTELTKSMAGLDAVLRSTGRYTPELSAAMRDYAGEVKRLTGVKSALVLEAEKVGSSFAGISNEEIPRTIKVAADLSAVFGTDLVSAVQLLGKASQGQTESLQRMGIRIDEAAVKSRGFSVVLDEVERRAGGAAKAQWEAAGGAEHLSAAVGSLKTAVGDLISVTVNNWLNDFAAGVQLVTEKVRGLGAYSLEQKKKELEDLARGFAGQWAWWEKLYKGEVGPGTAEAYVRLLKEIADQEERLARSGAKGSFAGGKSPIPGYSAPGKGKAAAAGHALPAPGVMPDVYAQMEAYRSALYEQSGVVQTFQLNEIEEEYRRHWERIGRIAQDGLAAEMGYTDEFASEMEFATARAADQVERDWSAAMGVLSSSLGTLATVGMQSQGEMFQVGKALAIAQAIINTYEGATKALAIGGPFGIPLMATVIAAGMAQVAMIQSQTPPARAFGGPVWPGESYLVGERGPELFSPRSAGAILPNDRLGGGGIVLHRPLTVNIAGSGLTRNEIAAAVVAGIKKGDRALIAAIRKTR